MTYEQLAALAEAAGFTAWGALNTAALELKPEVRDMCAANTCGQYEKRWSCPPGCGTLDECAGRLKQYPLGILVQTCGDVEDSFDIEAMAELERSHKTHFSQMLEALRRDGADVLPLGAGCCTQCGRCTYPEAPCRFPEKMVSSMEAYGLLVLEVCRASGLKYYYGPGKLAYTGCFLVK